MPSFRRSFGGAVVFGLEGLRDVERLVDCVH